MTEALNEARAAGECEGRGASAQPSRFIDSGLRPPVYFYHIPKTGGASLRSFLADQYSDGERLPAEHWPSLAKSNFTRSDIAKYRLFAGHFSANFSDYLPTGVRTFTFLRDPIQRFVSAVRHLMRVPRIAHARGLQDVIGGRSLKELIYEDRILNRYRRALVQSLCCDVPPEMTLEVARGQIASGDPVRIKTNWQSNPDKALARLNSFDFVGDTDDFENSLLALCEKFGFFPPETAPAINRWKDDPRSAQADLSYELSDADICHLRQSLGEDIALYETAKAGSLGSASRPQIIEDILRSGIMSEVRGPVVLDLGRPFSGSGWYKPDRRKDGPYFRWSGPRNVAMLYLPIARDYMREAKMLFMKPDGLPDVVVYVDDQIAHTRVSAHGRQFTLDFSVPPIQGGGRTGITTVKIDTGHVAAHGSARAVGVMLLSLELT